MKRTITLSPKHGVNPSVTHCPICGKETGVALLGRLKGDAEAPRDITDRQPCEDCKHVLDNGGHFILETRDGESGDNPYRTGRLVAITTDAAERLFSLRPVPAVAYMEHTLFERLFSEALKQQDNGQDSNQ